MKKVLSLLLSVLMLFSIVAGMNITVQAATYGRYYYKIKNGNCIITDYDEYGDNTRNLVIPSSINGYKVTQIGDGEWVFDEFWYGDSITIPNTVKVIGDYAFLMCNAERIIVPSSVESLGNQAFWGCDNLESISLLGVKTIDTYCFEDCRNLRSVYLGNSLTSIGDRAFSNCKKLTECDLPNSLEYIGYSAFAGCYSLESVRLGSNVQEVGAGAFRECFFTYDNYVDYSQAFDYGNFWGATLVDSDEDGYCAIDDCLMQIRPSYFDDYIITVPTRFRGVSVAAFNGLEAEEVQFSTNLRYFDLDPYRLHEYWLDAESFHPIIHYCGGYYSWLSIENSDFFDSWIDYGLAYMQYYSHEAGDWDIKPASCTQDGSYTYNCGLCGKRNVESFTIPKAATIRKSATSFNYNGKVQRPSIQVIDREGWYLEYKRDFTVSYSNWNSTEPGTYYVTVNLIGDYNDSRTYAYTINCTNHTSTKKTGMVPATCTADGNTGNWVCTKCGAVVQKGAAIPKSATIKKSSVTFTSDGNVHRPSIYVYDRTGKQLTYKTDFTVNYSNWSSTKVGRYTVTVDMIGKYNDTRTYAYYINPKPTNFLTSAQGGFKAVKNGFTLTWNKQTDQTTGYQIQYSTRSDFSNAATYTVSDPNQTSVTITGRATKTRYYVRVRTFTKNEQGTFYGDWNQGTKSVVTL